MRKTICPDKRGEMVKTCCLFQNPNSGSQQEEDVGLGLATDEPHSQMKDKRRLGGS